MKVSGPFSPLAHRVLSMAWIARSFSAFRSQFPWGRALLLTCVLALLAWGGYVGARQLWARRHLQVAQMALERDDLDLAQQHFEKCLQVRDDDSDIVLLAAQTARRRDDYDRADAYLTAYERLELIGKPPCFERELLIAQQGDPDSVQKRLKAVMNSRPDQAAAILEAVGKGYLNRFSKTDALECFNALLKLKPDYAVALLWRGKTYESMERYDKALQDYRRAVELALSLDDARLHLAKALHRSGRSWEAIPHFECLRPRQPKNAEVLLGLARCRCDLNELPEARQSLQALLAEHPDHGAALLELGRLEYHAGQAAEAEKLLRRAAAVAPHDENTHRALLLCLKAQGKDSEMRICLAQLDAIAVELRQYEILLQKTKTGQRDAPLFWQIGECLRRLGRDQDAVSYYYAALGEDGNFAPAHAALADYFQRTGQLYRAARYRPQARKAAESD
jgi:tetratricopeptide (TPR) repeat protein